MILNSWHDGGRFDCLRCGETYALNYPVPMDIWVAAVKAFERTHKRCKTHPEGDTCIYCHARQHEPKDCPYKAHFEEVANKSAPCEKCHSRQHATEDCQNVTIEVTV